MVAASSAAHRGVLIAGVSARALAASAAAAGWCVTAVDGYGDCDLEQSAHTISLRALGQTYTPRRVVRAARDLSCAAVAYVSNFENHPRALEALTRGRTLLGNAPETLVRVRDPLLLTRALRRRGFAVPETRASPPTTSARRWLRKPRKSGGGHGVTLWRGEPVGRGAVLQRRLSGTPGSIVFAADGRQAVPFALSRQLVGDAAFGAQGFQYCGSILAAAGDRHFPHDAALLTGATALAAAVTEEFALVGVNGVDFMAHDGRPWPVEVNPRPTASMELAERWYGLSIFAIHAAAVRGSLPDFDLAAASQRRGAIGKAVLYARQTLAMPDTRRWLADSSVRDIPHGGERITRGSPVCTIFAVGTDAADCYRALVRRADRLYSEWGIGRRSA